MTWKENERCIDAAQHSTAQHSTAQHSTAQHSAAQHSTAQHSTAQHSTVCLRAAAAHHLVQDQHAQHFPQKLHGLLVLQMRLFGSAELCTRGQRGSDLRAAPAGDEKKAA